MAKVMIIDDEPSMVSLVHDIMEKDGHEITEACDGMDALDQLGIDPPKTDVVLPDLIIMDVMMPIVDGYTLYTRFQESEKIRKIPLMVLTVKSQMKDVFLSSPNVTAFVEKPFDIKFLRDLVKKALNK